MRLFAAQASDRRHRRQVGRGHADSRPPTPGSCPVSEFSTRHGGREEVLAGYHTPAGFFLQFQAGLLCDAAAFAAALIFLIFLKTIMLWLQRGGGQAAPFWCKK